jgi:pimeloyl-ACP methyl ester carboxylesterase
LVSAPETVYAKTSAGRIGYQVLGTGPVDVLVVKPVFFPLDLMWEEPRLVRFLHGLSSFSRHIWFDARGTGSSDPIAAVEGRLIESVVDDMIGVLDDVGCDRAVVVSMTGAPGLQFAATHPERTSALVLISSSARLRRADDYPEGVADEDIEPFLTAVRDRWGNRGHEQLLGSRPGRRPQVRELVRTLRTALDDATGRRLAPSRWQRR